ncbi:AraC family transcriptional regulator [Hufsiella ginkgonis]|uniref:Helix-turn-helix domain-containing protein n=1 Tax=Hufsiella ginkgonis TaxID=2695274 RepID=A0A7K1Y1W4_9SPHI|nr:AraC family transcriptional regulator [Hufsiella ginkgonis]MXV17263.1 helix-turn-helix domain-containing protein [Hufsiella ginkgonis]
MKILQFTLPVAHDRTIIIQEEVLPHFYPYLHRHREAQLTWIIEGTGTLVAGTSMHTFAANEIYLLAANQPHLFKSDPEYFVPGSNKTIKALTVFFDPDGRLQSLLDLPEMKKLHAFVNQQQHGFKAPSRLTARLSAMISEVALQKGPSQVISFIRLLETLQAASEHLITLAFERSGNHVSESEGIRISTIYNYILKNYNKPLMLEDVAATAHMTPQAFCRYFKKHTGHTFISFLNNIRINEACNKLTNGGFGSISTVAYSCGFNSITNFNRVFKSVTGNSPSVFMESYAQKVN